MACIPKQKKRYQTLWSDRNHLLFPILAAHSNRVMIRYTYFTLVFAFLLISFGCSRSNQETKSQPEERTESTQNDLPDLTASLMNGDLIDMKDLSGNVIIVLFQPDCDHCQREAAAIRERIESFNGYQLYFLTADQLSAVEKFASDYDLLGQPNTTFVITMVDDILKNFGSVSTPSLYIYKNKKLVQKFNGETPIERILQAI